MPRQPTYRSSPHSAGASLRGAERRGNLREPGFSFTGIGLGVLPGCGSVLRAKVEASHLPFLAALRRSVIASHQHPRRGPPPAATRLCSVRTRDGVFAILAIWRGPSAFFWYPLPVFLRGAERRGNLREPGLSFTGIGLGVIAAPGPVLPANAEAPRLPFLAAPRKSVIARSRATRQSTRSGVLDRGDRPGSTHRSGAKYWKPGSRRLPRRSVMPGPWCWRSEPSTRVGSGRSPSSTTSRNDVHGGWVVGTRGVLAPSQ